MNTNETRPRRVAYLINQYPKISHSFIRREILALEAQGVTVMRYAVRGWDAELVDADDRAEQARTTYLLQRGLLPLLLAVLRCAATQPWALTRAMGAALQLAWGADRPLPYHLVYLAQACLLHRLLTQAGLRHVHAHFGTNATEVAQLCKALGGVSYSFTVHGPEEFDKPEALHLPAKVRDAAFVVAISQYGRSQLWRWTPPEQWPKVHVVHCALAPDSFAAAAALAPQPTARLLCVGRLSAQKGQVLLIDALAGLRARGVHAELVLAGDGEMRPDVQARVDALGLGDAVHITGWVDAPRIQAELQAARAMVLPSFAEGLPVVLMEALAQGRPVVTTMVAGIPELVQHGRNGWLVPAGDCEALVDAMATCLAADAATLAEMGAAGHRRVAERHSVSGSAERLARHFEAARAW